MKIPARIPFWIKWIYPSFTWQMPSNEKVLYLTFDDGPHPTITPLVLDLLAHYNAKATFFCIGDCVKKYPDVVKRIVDEGHSLGNHTQHHVNGWKSSVSAYKEEVHQASSLIASTLFRPPYGRIKRKQAKLLEHEGYKIIMWTILSADYDHSLNKEECANRVTSHIDNGNIYLFHDSDKGEERMLHALPILLKLASAKGFLFKRIDNLD